MAGGATFSTRVWAVSQRPRTADRTPPCAALAGARRSISISKGQIIGGIAGGSSGQSHLASRKAAAGRLGFSRRLGKITTARLPFGHLGRAQGAEEVAITTQHQPTLRKRKNQIGRASCRE